jgi:hypothetical protein
VEDRLAAYLFDAAVVTFGSILENALAERVNAGSERNPRYEAKYTLSELLDQSFHLPRSDKPGKAKAAGGFGNGVAQVLALAQQPNMGVKRWTYIAPEAKPS